MRVLFAIAAGTLLMSCEGQPGYSSTVSNPTEELKIDLFQGDPGGCCSGRVVGKISSNSKRFELSDNDVFDIRGASDVKVRWIGDFDLEVIVCIAKSASITSDYSIEDFRDHVHVYLRNLRPDRQGGKVICNQ